MEKLTLRQFADVVKALVEANLSKEAEDDCTYTVSLISNTSQKADGGIQMVLKGEKTVKAEIADTEDDCEISSYESYTSEADFDMNSQYNEYVKQMDENSKIQSDILKSIAMNIAEEIKSSDEIDNEDYFDECEDKNICKCIAKAALICAAIPAGIMITKKLLKKE